MINKLPNFIVFFLQVLLLKKKLLHHQVLLQLLPIYKQQRPMPFAPNPVQLQLHHRHHLQHLQKLSKSLPLVLCQWKILICSRFLEPEPMEKSF